jgi:hypothetical protein
MQLKVDFASKLALVRLIKDCTDLGLRDSKFIADELQENLKRGIKKSVEINLRSGVDGMGNSYIKIFQKGISDLDIDCFISGGVAWERNFKMLFIGIGNKEDYSDFIVEYINTIDREHGKDIIGLMIDKLSKDDLEEVFGKISKEINYDKEIKYDSSL